MKRLDPLQETGHAKNRRVGAASFVGEAEAPNARPGRHASRGSRISRRDAWDWLTRGAFGYDAFLPFSEAGASPQKSPR